MAQARSWRHPHQPALVVAAVFALLAAGWWLTSAGRTAVVTVLPTRGDAAEVVYATGVVEPKLWAKVVALDRRRITDMCACEGQKVEKGDVLARLDDAEERAVLTELEARRATLSDDVTRTERLVERNAVSRVSLDEKRTQLAEIDARIAARKDRLEDLVLKAPMSGVVLRKDGEVGEIAGTGSADELFWVGQPKPLQVEAEVNEEDISKVKAGQTVLLRHEGHLDGPLKATVQEITPKGNPATKTFRVTLSLPDDTPLMIGMSVEANIVVREAKDVLLVPADAVIDGAVFRVANGRLVSTPVVTGIRGNRMVEIVDGLAAGAAVVSPSSAELKNGQRVRVTSSGPS